MKKRGVLSSGVLVAGFATANTAGVHPSEASREQFPAPRQQSAMLHGCFFSCSNRLIKLLAGGGEVTWGGPEVKASPPPRADARTQHFSVQRRLTPFEAVGTSSPQTNAAAATWRCPGHVYSPKPSASQRASISKPARRRKRHLLMGDDRAGNHDAREKRDENKEPPPTGELGRRLLQLLIIRT